MLRIRKDKNKCVRYLFSVLFALLAFCFTSFIIDQENSVYAVSDISVTFNQGQVINAYTDYFSNCSGSCLKDYDYLIIERLSSDSDINSGQLTSNVSFGLRVCRFANGTQCGNKYLNLPVFMTYAVYKVGFTSQDEPVFANYNNISYTFPASYKITLSASAPGSSVPSGSITLSENGTYDVTSYAEAVVDVPAEVVPGDYDDEFNGVIIAIYTCGAIVIMIYFFYIIYGIIIKPTGGSK